MANPARYFVVRDGRFAGRWSRFGATSIPRDLFWGPAWLEQALERLQSDDTIDDETEGGVVLDHATKTALWFDGGHWMTEPGEDDEPAPSDAFLPLLEASWRMDGWSLRRVEGPKAFAEHLGVELVVQPVPAGFVPFVLPTSAAGAPRAAADAGAALEAHFDRIARVLLAETSFAEELDADLAAREKEGWTVPDADGAPGEIDEPTRVRRLAAAVREVSPEFAAHLEADGGED
jgi:hypothetical protein